MIDARRLVDLLTAHIREHGTGQVQAYAPAGLAPHGTVDVLGCELERAEDGTWLMVLRLGSDER